MGGVPEVLEVQGAGGACVTDEERKAAGLVKWRCALSMDAPANAPSWATCGFVFWLDRPREGMVEPAIRRCPKCDMMSCMVVGGD